MRELCILYFYSFISYKPPICLWNTAKDGKIVFFLNIQSEKLALRRFSLWQQFITLNKNVGSFSFYFTLMYPKIKLSQKNYLTAINNNFVVLVNIIWDSFCSCNECKIFKNSTLFALNNPFKCKIFFHPFNSCIRGLRLLFFIGSFTQYNSV